VPLARGGPSNVFYVSAIPLGHALSLTDFPPRGAFRFIPPLFYMDVAMCAGPRSVSGQRGDRNLFLRSSALSPAGVAFEDLVCLFPSDHFTLLKTPVFSCGSRREYGGILIVPCDKALNLPPLCRRGSFFFHVPLPFSGSLVATSRIFTVHSSVTGLSLPRDQLPLISHIDTLGSEGGSLRPPLYFFPRRFFHFEDIFFHFPLRM